MLFRRSMLRLTSVGGAPHRRSRFAACIFPPPAPPAPPPLPFFSNFDGPSEEVAVEAAEEVEEDSVSSWLETDVAVNSDSSTTVSLSNAIVGPTSKRSVLNLLDPDWSDEYMHGRQDGSLGGKHVANVPALMAILKGNRAEDVGQQGQKLAPPLADLLDTVGNLAPRLLHRLLSVCRHARAYGFGMRLASEWMSQNSGWPESLCGSDATSSDLLMLEMVQLLCWNMIPRQTGISDVDIFCEFVLRRVIRRFRKGLSPSGRLMERESLFWSIYIAHCCYRACPTHDPTVPRGRLFVRVTRRILSQFNRLLVQGMNSSGSSTATAAGDNAEARDDPVSPEEAMRLVLERMHDGRSPFEFWKSLFDEGQRPKDSCPDIRRTMGLTHRTVTKAQLIHALLCPLAVNHLIQTCSYEASDDHAYSREGRDSSATKAQMAITYFRRYSDVCQRNNQKPYFPEFLHLLATLAAHGHRDIVETISKEMLPFAAAASLRLVLIRFCIMAVSRSGAVEYLTDSTADAVSSKPQEGAFVLTEDLALVLKLPLSVVQSAILKTLTVHSAIGTSGEPSVSRYGDWWNYFLENKLWQNVQDSVHVLQHLQRTAEQAAVEARWASSSTQPSHCSGALYDVAEKGIFLVAGWLLEHSPPVKSEAEDEGRHQHHDAETADTLVDLFAPYLQWGELNSRFRHLLSGHTVPMVAGRRNALIHLFASCYRVDLVHALLQWRGGVATMPLTKSCLSTVAKMLHALRMDAQTAVAQSAPSRRSGTSSRGGQDKSSNQKQLAVDVALSLSHALERTEGAMQGMRSSDPFVSWFLRGELHAESSVPSMHQLASPHLTRRELRKKDPALPGLNYRRRAGLREALLLASTEDGPEGDNAVKVSEKFEQYEKLMKDCSSTAL